MPEEKKIEATEPEEKIEISKSKLDEFISRMDNIEKENEILKKSVSSSKYNFEKEKLDQDKTPTVRFKMYDGVPIVGLKSLAQKLIRSPMTGQIVNEEVRYSFKFIDGSEKEIPYVDFYTIIDHAIAHVVDRRTDHKVEMLDGKVHDHEEIFTCEFIDDELRGKYGRFDVPVSYINL